MSLALSQTKTALAVNLTASFLAVGGTGPYTYAVVPGGAGGTIDSGTGVYTAPATVNDDPRLLYDTIEVTDFLLATATSTILVGDPLLLFCEILEQELELSPGRVFLWDQKIFQPTDSGLFVVVSVSHCKPFASVIKPGPTGWDTATQSVSMLATLDIDAISRGASARTRKEEIVLALNSIYSEAQQEANSFFIGRLPPGSQFVNLSGIDGAAIPYRFKISVNMQYVVTKSKAVPYFDNFEDVEVTTES